MGTNVPAGFGGVRGKSWGEEGVVAWEFRLQYQLTTLYAVSWDEYLASTNVSSNFAQNLVEVRYVSSDPCFFKSPFYGSWNTPTPGSGPLRLKTQDANYKLQLLNKSSISSDILTFIQGI